MLVDLFYRGSFWVLLPDRTAILLAFYATTISCLQETVILYDSHFLLNKWSTIITCLHIIKWLLEEKTILGKLWSLSSGKDNMVILWKITSIISSKRIGKENKTDKIKSAISFILEKKLSNFKTNSPGVNDLRFRSNASNRFFSNSFWQIWLNLLNYLAAYMYLWNRFIKCQIKFQMKCSLDTKVWWTFHS